MDLSIIIPVYNSENILKKLVSEIEKSTSKRSLKKEIILINDCSKDNSWETIKSLQKKNKSLKGINLQDNFGQHNAIMAGLNLCSGKICVLIKEFSSVAGGSFGKNSSVSPIGLSMCNLSPATVTMNKLGS